MSWSAFSSKVFKVIADNSPLILTGIGVAGTISTAVLTGKAVLKADRILNEEMQDLTPLEKAKLVWHCYIPPIGMGLLTIGSIVFANRIGTRRAAALAAAYSISEKALIEYREKVVEKIGDAQERAIRDEIAQDHVSREPVSEREVIITGSGTVLCFDSLSGRYFNSDMEALRRAQNDLNHTIISNSYASLHEFYELIGLKPTLYSSEVGWNADDLLEITFSATLSEDGRPCISMDYSTFPIRSYY